MLLVITPTLGKSRYLDETVHSVANLRDVSLHYLVCPKDRCTDLEQRYPRCKVIPECRGTKGVYSALNQALEAIDTPWDWFTYINDDDLLLSGFGELCRAHFSSGDNVIAYGDAVYIDTDGRELFPFPRETEPRHFRALMRRGIAPFIQQGSLISRAMMQRLRGFNSELQICADFDLFVRALVNADALFKYYPYRVGAFRFVPGQISGDIQRLKSECDLICKNWLPHRGGMMPDFYSVARFRLINWYAYLVRIKARGLQRSSEILHNTVK